MGVGWGGGKDQGRNVGRSQLETPENARLRSLDFIPEVSNLLEVAAPSFFWTIEVKLGVSCANDYTKITRRQFI